MNLAKKIVIGLLSIGILSGCSSSGESTGSTEVPSTEREEVTVYFTRHGKTMLNTTGRSQGWSDSPLTPAGIEVAEDVGKGIGDTIKFDKVYSSDSGRAIETAEIIMDNAGQKEKVLKDKRLREFNFGTFEATSGAESVKAIAERKNLSADEYTKKAANEGGGYTGFIKELSDDLAEIDKENVQEDSNWPAEDYETVAKRSTEALKEIVNKASENGDESILIVSHGMTLATLLNELDASVSSKIPMSGLENASISKAIYHDGKWKVESVNDMSYAEKGAKN
ncbi:histidine phosphatase family protein [Enterococcus raffinosus]|jgi:broad specificity phosphatase PhoE|uniref:histidine phosphatase family protein n=1 Tax=Enterococcus raffinosus TaxID=71452 RepID=UPI001C489B20|nr:histidine phosphatase family protein [Enterococcus raffinosus]MDT2570543.1 histidine phosphatase family protein [Enterococcus raffinosus]QXJ60798.1 histidine phosphatase family protein [Enterococcus raffinosus]